MLVFCGGLKVLGYMAEGRKRGLLVVSSVTFQRSLFVFEESDLVSSICTC